MEKYRRLSFILIFSLIIFITAFIFTRQSGNNTPTADSPTNISASEVKSDKQPTPVTDKEEYMLLLEGKTLHAYRIRNGSKSLIEKAEIETSSITLEAVELLEQGIYASTLEELFLYYESYTS